MIDLGENVEACSEDAAVVIGSETGRVVATFRDAEYAKEYMSIVNGKMTFLTWAPNGAGFDFRVVEGSKVYSDSGDLVSTFSHCAEADSFVRFVMNS